jgi:cytidylate kinase
MGIGPVVTVDGPAGAGKSTVSRILAAELSFFYLDTGALYRALAYRAMKANVSPDDREAVRRLCGETDIELVPSGREFRILVSGEDVTGNLRTEALGRFASAISACETVRTALLQVQRNVAALGGVVAEGRDMGSVVFPDAQFKFFLTANLSERAKRRFIELGERRDPAPYETVEKEIEERDVRDRGREIAPLRIPEDAVVIDSTHLSIAGVVEKMKSVILGGT